MHQNRLDSSFVVKLNSLMSNHISCISITFLFIDKMRLNQLFAAAIICTVHSLPMPRGTCTRTTIVNGVETVVDCSAPAQSSTQTNGATVGQYIAHGIAAVARAGVAGVSAILNGMAAANQANNPALQGNTTDLVPVSLLPVQSLMPIESNGTDPLSTTTLDWLQPTETAATSIVATETPLPPEPTPPPEEQTRPDDPDDEKVNCKDGLKRLSDLCWNEELYILHKNRRTLNTLKPADDHECPEGTELAPEEEYCIATKYARLLKENAQSQFPLDKEDADAEKLKNNQDIQDAYMALLFKHLLADGDETNCDKNSYRTRNGRCACKIGFKRRDGTCVGQGEIKPEERDE